DFLATKRGLNPTGFVVVWVDGSSVGVLDCSGLGSWSSWLVAALVTPALKRGLKPVGLDITSSVAVVAASSDADGPSATLFSCTDSALGSSFSSSFLGRFAALNLGVKPLGLGATMEASSFASGADSS